GRDGRLQPPQPAVRGAKFGTGEGRGVDASVDDVFDRVWLRADYLGRCAACSSWQDNCRRVYDVQSLPHAPNLAADRARIRGESLPARHCESETSERDSADPAF